MKHPDPRRLLRSMAAKGLSIDNNGGHCERYPTKEPGSKSKAEGVFMFEVSAADAPPAF